MNILDDTSFQIFIDGVQTGNINGWKHTSLMITSPWKAGSDEEKFEVLSAMRKTYSCENYDIRGSHNLGPSQIARNEGFSQLSYRRETSLSLQVTIIPRVLPYRHLAPRTFFRKIDWLRRSS